MLTGGIGTIIAWVKGKPRCFVEVALWSARNGKYLCRPDLRLKRSVFKLRGMRAAEAIFGN
jgi:hypothetical protein